LPIHKWTEYTIIGKGIVTISQIKKALGEKSITHGANHEKTHTFTLDGSRQNSRCREVGLNMTDLSKGGKLWPNINGGTAVLNTK
jgi:hypothetical protein